MYVLVFYVPVSHLEPVKEALFQAGAGNVGNYDCCAFQVRGTGQFRPLEGSSPFSGTPGALEQTEEYRVEMVLEESSAREAVRALLKAHPYEVPAYHLIRMESVQLLPVSAD